MEDGTEVLCETFQEAAVKHGLFEDDEEIEKSLQEAASFKMPREFRKCFETRLTYMISMAFTNC